MARYAISQEGADAMRQLSEDITSSVDGIENATVNLQNQVMGLMDELGVYGFDIWAITLQINGILEDKKETLFELASKAKAKSEEISEMIGFSIASSSEALEKSIASIESKLEKEFVDGMRQVLTESKHDDVKNIYAKYSSELTVADANHKGGAFYTYGQGVCINTQQVSVGDVIHKPYQTAFHEFGHNIDYLMGNGMPISESWGNGALLDAINSDFENLKGNLTNEELIEKLRLQAKNENWSIMDTASVSDILECLTGKDFPLGAGHGADYWINPTRLPCKEFFAETLDGAAANERSYNIMKQLFPQGIDVVHKILGGDLS